MFTGIIEAVGTIDCMRPSGGDVSLRVKTGALPIDDVALGDSIAVNGVCLTAVKLPGDGFWADVSKETISLTSFQFLKEGSSVNLEKALMPTSRLGGHLVSGHVDGIGEVVERTEDARSVRFKIRTPDELARYVAQKGSICIDGISLTVNGVNGSVFDINIIPHTMAATVIKDYRPGTQVNLEVDLIARYLERLLLGDKAAEPDTQAGADYMRLLHENGFVSG